MRSPALFLFLLAAGALAACDSDPTPEEGASGAAVEATVNQAENALEAAEERANDPSEGKTDNTAIPPIG